MKYTFSSVVLIAVLFFSCKQNSPVDIPIPSSPDYTADYLKFSRAEYADKILGALVGSAIGDAMGASTEMWYRKDIQNKYGYITGLTPATREKSPEGTWKHNLNSGATTDDTRWKYFTGKYLIENEEEINKETFAEFVIDYYQSLTKGISDDKIGQNTDLLDEEMEKINWIKEWARVSLAYKESPEAYQAAQSRFYGGEMSCAGMLYGPVFGLISSSPLSAYQMGYEHSLFDLGYAKDITALTAGMTRIALGGLGMDSIMDHAFLLDPLGYADSRLIGRLSVNIARESRSFVEKSMKNKNISDTIQPPFNYPGTTEDWIIQNAIYFDLEKRQKAIPFHAGEIWQILIAGLEYGQGDFLRTMQFIVNYGRDNDTVAAVAGMILGANLGFSNLPSIEKTRILEVTKNVIGIDLEILTNEIADQYHSNWK